MKIVHIAHVDDILGGVNVAVPQHVKAQENFADVAFINLTNKKLDGIANQLEYTAPFKGFPAPYEKPDLVVFHEVYRPPYISIYKHLLKQGIPYIIIPHGGLTKTAQHIKRLKKVLGNALLFKRFIKKAIAIQCLSDNEIKNIAFPLKTLYGTNGVSISSKKEYVPDESLTIVFIGRLDTHIKGLDLLLDALMLEADFLRSSRAFVHLYGPAEKEVRADLLKRIRENRIEDFVYIHEAVLGEEKQKVLLAADCFIQTSRSEGMSMGILEALGVGLPCIVTEGTGMVEKIRQYDAGWGCKTDIDGIRSVLRQVVMEKELIREKSEHAKKLVEEHYSWDIVAKETIQKYNQLLQT